MMRFWRLQHPEYDSDYRHSYINGSLEHPFGLPGVECDVCGQTWGGSRELPFACPAAFHNHPHITSGWPISRGAHEALQRELMAALAISGEPFIDLCPGDDFQPCFLDVPSRPRADFLWSSFGSLVVSERIKDALIESCSDDVAAFPVTLRKVGKRNARLPPPIASTGEPEDTINEVPLLKDTAGIGPYFEIVILKRSDYHLPGGVPKMFLCPGCKRLDVLGWPPRIRMAPEMWKGDNIFFLSLTLNVVITEELMRRLASLRPTNVVFQET